jgi:signal transduction histidine kinase
MTAEPLHEASLYRTAIALLDAAICKGDDALGKLTELCDPDFSGFGTGKDEVVSSFQEYLDFYRREEEQAPGVTYHLIRSSTKIIGSVGILEGELNLLVKLPDGNQEIYSRFTLVFAHKHDKWKVVSGHFSFPSSEQAEGESYPVDALKARNLELERLVSKRTALLQQKTEELELALESLKKAQVQLIQQEKLASLGELTAGIAHEIQNPLNFVNNFSEVSGELLEELKEELEGQEQESDQVEGILEDLALNLQKIQQHGRRADSIVKGMLQHSRSNAGEKKETDLNALADEYLHLAYHGLRARDTSFNATLSTDFDLDLPKVAVIPQNLGRVLLNLFNNAFYATREKQKTAGPAFKPEVLVSTRQKASQVEIRVRDNGSGIPAEVRAKIFQPFFTTKPAGQGTGLGLSLTYEIVIQGHGGEVEVETREGEFTEFLIRLPMLQE